MKYFVADDAPRWDELLQVILMTCNRHFHGSTGSDLFDLVIPRRSLNLTVRKFPPGTPLTNKGTLNDGSPLASRFEFMAPLLRQHTTFYDLQFFVSPPTFPTAVLPPET